MRYILHSYKCQPFLVSLRPASQTCGGTKGVSLSYTHSACTSHARTLINVNPFSCLCVLSYLPTSQTFIQNIWQSDIIFGEATRAKPPGIYISPFPNEPLHSLHNTPYCFNPPPPPLDGIGWRDRDGGIVPVFLFFVLPFCLHMSSCPNFGMLAFRPLPSPLGWWAARNRKFRRIWDVSGVVRDKISLSFGSLDRFPHPRDVVVDCRQLSSVICRCWCFSFSPTRVSSSCVLRKKLK